MNIASVLLPLPFDKSFDYAVPEGLEVEPGSYVRVPFGSRELFGVVWEVQASEFDEVQTTFAIVPQSVTTTTNKDGKQVKLKFIHSVVSHVPPLPEPMREFIDWVSWYTLTRKGMVLKMVMPMSDALHPPGTMTHYTLALPPSIPPASGRDVRGGIRMTAARQRVASLLEDGFTRTAAQIAEETGVSASTVRKFAEIGGLEAHELTIESASVSYDMSVAKKPLSERQQEAAAELADRLGQGFSVSVLDGVTGSGKTEVYFDTIAKVLTGHSPSEGVDESKQSAARSGGGKLRPTQASKSVNFAKTLRQNLTDAEKKLWHCLNRRQMDDFKFRRQDTLVLPLRESGFLPQILILLPEIALSVQWLKRFKERFGAEPHLWHSAVPIAQKRHSWRAIASGKAQVVVGARSALFLPFNNLQLIIVDEEHEPSYKQEEGAMYQGRDMAVIRAQKEQVPIMLVSATPSLETYVNIEQGRYHKVPLPHRHGGATMPEVATIDMRQHKPGRQHWISEPLREAIEETIDAKRQAMLFINRRGYAPLVLCQSCGHRFGCPHCSAWLVEHRVPPRLQCHHCDYRIPMPSHCTECGEVAEEALVPCGPGVERLAQEAEKLFPDARIGLMTSDSLNTPEQAERLIEAVTEGRIDILIGTQMMAKGHHFPELALVGVVDADLGLAGGDLRASERSWQLLHQLAGRAGRAKVAGKVLLQTYMPEHPVIEALKTHDRDRFMALEQQQRQRAKMPPFGRLVALIVEGPKEGLVQQFSQQIARTAPGYDGVRCLGPAPAPLAILRDKYRYRLLVKTPKETNVPQLLRQWLEPLTPPNSVRLKIDIDPYSFM
jgi:primosomal protein N'